MSGKPMDPEQAAREWAQNSSDNDGRRWLAVGLRGAGLEAYAAACVLADLGPRGGETTRSDREDATRVLVTELSKACARATSWRSQCPVTAEHVEAAGVTYEKLDAWAADNSLAPARATDYQRHECRGLSDVGWACEGIFHGYSTSWPGNRGWATTGADIAGFIAFASELLGRPAHDILDEMAALEPGR